MQFIGTTGVFVFGVPRGGTNLFCAILHNHSQVMALAQTGTKKFLESRDVSNRPTIHAVSMEPEDGIYRKGGFRKNIDGVTHIVYDKVHFDRTKRWFYWDKAKYLLEQGSFFGIVVIRHPFAVLSSMHQFHIKFYRQRWAFTVENVADFYQHYFRPQIMLLRETSCHGVVFERFMQDRESGCQDLCKYLRLPFEHYMTSFRSTFEKMGTPLGGVFEVKEIADYSGSNLEERGIHVDPQPMYVDPSTGVYTLGRGGFNPYEFLDPQRVMQGWQNRNNQHERIFRRVFSRAMSMDDVKYLLETPIPTLDRLRDLDVKDIDNYQKRVSYIPKALRAVRLRIRRLLPLAHFKV